MPDYPRFGPAGKPIDFKGDIAEVPAYLRNEGLDAFEYQAVRGVRISKPDAVRLGEAAESNGVLLTLHGPYFVNLCGSKRVVSASIQRLFESMRAAYWMDAKQVVFHLGFYVGQPKDKALDMCISAMKRVLEKSRSFGVSGVYLGPELTGKPTQVGSLEEIVQICQQVDDARPTVDWAHLHARENGRIKTKDDYLEVMRFIEDKLGSNVLKNLHTHFTNVEFTAKGERRHRPLEELGFGPSFKDLAEITAEQKLAPTIISESPMLDLDSIKMREIFMSFMKS